LNDSDLNGKVRVLQEVRKAYEFLKELVQALAPRGLAARWKTMGRGRERENPTLTGYRID
jgi:hypothetical protein